MLLTQLLKPELLAKMSPEALSRITLALEAEILTNADVRKRLKTKVDELAKHLQPPEK